MSTPLSWRDAFVEIRRVVDPIVHLLDRRFHPVQARLQRIDWINDTRRGVKVN
jgi:hypothetical protein